MSHGVVEIHNAQFVIENQAIMTQNLLRIVLL